MKCPQCQSKQKHSQGMNCVSCGYQYVINPKTSGSLSDNKLQVLASNVSGNGTYHFTYHQLLGYFLRRTLAEKRRGSVILAVICVVAVPIMWVVDLRFCMVVPIIVFLGSMLSLWGRLPVAKPDVALRVQMDKALDDWKAAGRELEKMITKPTLHEPPPDWPDRDVYDYGVERILVVEHDLLVDLFVLNGFHTLHNALVIAESGYPDYLLPRLQQLLQERADLPVYLLHDATPDGVAMQDRIHSATDLPFGEHPIVDLGLMPQDVAMIQSLRWTKHTSFPQMGLPVDLMPYATLAAIAGDAIDTGQPLGDVAAAAIATGGESAGSYG